MKLSRTDGEHSRTRKVTDKQAARIRQLYSEGKASAKQAAKFGIGMGQFLKIGRGQYWKAAKLNRLLVISTRGKNDE